MQKIFISHAQKDSEIVEGKKEQDYGFSGVSHQKFRPIRSKPIFRNNPKEISEKEVQEMTIKNDFFDKNRNKKGRGFDNQFEILDIKEDKLIFDYSTGLMWQQQGSLESMSFEQANRWIEELNRIRYANYCDWRLPTLEEAMSLLKRERKNGKLFNDNIFSQKQSGIWTSDVTENRILAWVVFFNYGSCYVNCFDLENYIRAVRSA
jgi:hypothetical protein